MFRYLLFFAAASSAGLPGVFAQESVNLTLEGAVLQALANNLDVRIERLSPEVAEQRLEASRGRAFDPRAELQATFEEAHTPKTSQSLVTNFLSSTAQDPVVDEENVRFQGTVSGQIATGMRYAVSAGISHLDNDYAPGVDDYVTTLTLNVAQPLFQGRGADATKAEIRLAEGALTEARNTLSARTMVTISNVAREYAELVFAQEDLRVKQEAVSLAEKLLAENKRRVELRVMAPIDVVQAEAAVAEREAELISAELFLSERQNTLKTLLFDDFSPVAGQALVAVDSISTEVPPMEFATLMQNLITQNPDYLNALNGVSNEDIRVKFAENQLWPRVDLVGSLGANGYDQADYGNSFSDSFDQDVSWSVGVVVGFSFGAREKKANLSEAEIRKRRALIRLKNVENQLAGALVTAIDRVRASDRRMATAQKAVDLAENSLELELKRLENGVTTSYNVLKVQEEVSDAKTRALASRVQLSQARTALGLVMGTLPSQFGIRVDEF